MSRRRFIADESSADRAALVGAHAAHLSRVLRVSIGEEFDIAANGRVRRGRIIAVSADRVEFALGEDVPVVALAPVTLWLAVFKFDRMEWAIEKCVELGVQHIVPVVAARTDAHLAAAAPRRLERWRRLALQASEQSRRPAAPEIASLSPLKRDLLTAAAGTRIVLAESEQGTTLRDALTPAGAEEIHLAIGPEGGWTASELALFAALGWISASLGPTILRAETAAIAALAIVMSR